MASSLKKARVYIFFNKLAAYLNCAVSFVFVFGGPERPPIKRGKKVRDVLPWWTDRAKDLIHYFGYHVHQVSQILSYLIAKFSRLVLTVIF